MKITLRKYKLSDLNRLCELFIDDAVLDNLAVPMKAKDLSKKDEEKWLQETIQGYDDKNPASYNLAIIVDGKLAGSIGTHHVDYKDKKTEIGYWIGKQYWGKGIMPQAIKKFVKDIEKRFGFEIIIATPFSHNKASQRVLEKAGFEFKEERKKALEKHGKCMDEKIYVINKTGTEIKIHEKPITYINEEGKIMKLKPGEKWEKPDYKLGRYQNGRFTAYGSKKSVKAKISKEFEGFDKPIHGSFKKGVFKPFGG